jgi:hypothetical protein
MKPLVPSLVQPSLGPWAIVAHGLLLETPCSSSALDLVIKGISEQIQAAGHASINFGLVDPRRANPILLATALRMCFSHRQDIPSWDAGVLGAIEACAREGVDARKALRGLL